MHFHTLNIICTTVDLHIFIKVIMVSLPQYFLIYFIGDDSKETDTIYLSTTMLLIALKEKKYPKMPNRIGGYTVRW